MNRALLRVITFCSLCFIDSPLFANVTELTYINFDNGVLQPPNWVIGAQHGATAVVSTDITKNLNGSAGSLKVNYPIAPGDVYAWAEYNVASLNTNELYFDFWAKMPGVKFGLKFLKIFGVGNGVVGYSNTTFGLDYTGVDLGAMYQVSFGDGSSIFNDTANVINFNGTYKNWIGRSYGLPNNNVYTINKNFGSADWGTNWHHFRIKLKYNSGTTAQNEVNDGEYYVEIDNIVYVDAHGLFNRHYSNQPINYVGFLNWTQAGTQPFEIWLDNIRITRGGFLPSYAPKKPVLNSVK